ncbi:hypothetical protein COX93_00720, partial [Candidatus Nomurabacteria bacterium CG_4_10_14_0_2_um_filter_30_12]
KVVKIDKTKIQDAINSLSSEDDVVLDNLISFINNGCQLIQQVGTHVVQFLSFVCEVVILGVKEFVVGDFYKSGENNGIKLFFGSNFETWILNPMKKMEIFLPESKLKKHLLIKNAYDTEMQTDFLEKPIIPIKQFMAQLKNMILAQSNGEVKKDGLDVSGKANIFHVDLSKLGDNRVVAVYVYRFGVGWDVDADEFGYIGRWGESRSFFTPATKAEA